jgi:hypothetical protein
MQMGRNGFFRLDTTASGSKPINMRFIFILALLPYPVFLHAQPDGVLVGSGNSAFQENIQASDGDYDKFVLIRWNATEKGGTYRLFRANNDKGASMIELTKGWQRSNWFCDYSAEKGREYYYAIMTQEGQKTTPLSRFDKGFLRKPDSKMVQDGSLSSLSTDKYAEGKLTYVLVSEIIPDSTQYLPGATAALKIRLQNIFDEPSLRTELRIYLSSNAEWDFEDRLLSTKNYSGFPAGFNAFVEEHLTLPTDILPAEYYLLAVAVPEGKILHAKISPSQIKIEKR